MEAMVYDIADLFDEGEVTCDETGSLRSVAALLETYGPHLLLLTNTEGKISVAKIFENETVRQPPDILANELREGLADRDVYLRNVAFGDEFWSIFGLRLSTRAEQGILGGVLRHGEAFEKNLAKMRKTYVVCGDLAWIAVHERSKNATLQTQLQHLINEKDTLKASHSRAVSNALEEHEQRLRDQQEHVTRLERLHLQNKMILNSAGEGIFGLDREGKITFVNPAGAEMVGWDPEMLVGQMQHHLIHHTKRNGKPYELESCPIYRTLRYGAVGNGDNELFWRKNGTSFPVEYTSTPIWEDNEIIGAVLTFRDTTERKALERQLAQAQKLESIGHLAAGIAHEINTPTQYIGDNTRFFQDALGDLHVVLDHFRQLLEAAQQKAITDDLVEKVQNAIVEADLEYLTEEMSKAVEQSLEGLQQVARIVRSMKEFSHPGSDEKQAVDLNRAIENTLTVSRNEWKYIADTATELDPTLPPVNCLPGECNQVFLNLIINASHAIADRIKDGTTEKATTEKGMIRISTRHDGNWAEIRVQDNGTGIPEEARSRVMDPFFTTKEVGRGTGQGLAIAYSVIVEKHGGTLTFETEMNQGTTFIIRLPIDQESSSTASA